MVPVFDAHLEKIICNFVLFTPAVYFPETILQEQYQTHLAI
jgi:hypothetical protein